MAMIDAFADLFEETANLPDVTPANLAKPANNRTTASPAIVANACESLRIADETDQRETRFADIRSNSQTAKTAPECGHSHDSQHSQEEDAEIFANPTSCATCHHRTLMKSCGVPVLAGLSERFAIRWHEQDGENCTAWRKKQ